MIKPTVLKVSVIIPCYNEQDSLPRCLEALTSQSIKPYEVIVVDNNSTDKTAELARSFGAKVIKEKSQGVIAARNSGMNAAKGDILARIDADTAVTADWVEELLRSFSDNEVVAVSGTGDFYDLPFTSGSRAFRNFFAVTLNRWILGHNMLWGSNMAIRESAWRSVYPTLCHKSDIMEDLDIAIHMAAEFGGSSISYNPAMKADISARRATAGLFKNYLYMKMWPDTLRPHKGLRSHLLWPAVGFAVVVVGPYTGGIMRIYDGDSRRWKLNPRQWLKAKNFDRGNP